VAANAQASATALIIALPTTNLASPRNVLRITGCSHKNQCERLTVANACNGH
jgi:hypothetical protein